MSEVKVSIIMPVYNAEKYLKETLESVKRQSFKDFELIAINDGSVDSSKKILESYVDDINIKIINKENSGVSASRNRGIAEATGKYICFLDSDDVLHRDYLSVLYDVALKQDSDIVFCEYEPFYGTFYERSYEKDIVSEELYGTYKQKTFDYVMDIGLATSPCIKMYKASLIKEKVIAFNEKSSYGEDMFFNWKVFLVSNKVYYIKKILYGYRQNVGSITTKYHDNLFETYLNEYEQLKMFGGINSVDSITLNNSINKNLLKVLPSFLRMNIRRKSPILDKYKYVKEISNHDDIWHALQEWKEGNNVKNKLYHAMINKKYFQALCHGAYMEYRFRLARCIKSWRARNGRK